MTPQDYDVKLLDVYAYRELKDCKHNLLLSPYPEQCELFQQYFSNAINIPSHKGRWDITNPNEDKYDIIFAASVLMMVTESEKAIENILNSCKWFFLQDLIIRWRSGHEFGTDGDCMRYYVKGLSSKPDYPNAFDLSYLGDKIIHFKEYKDENKNISFVALIKGNLCS